MIFKKKVFFFKTIRYVLEDWPDLELLKKKYSAVYILSYSYRDLPGWHIKPKDTPLICLDQPLEKIFASFNHTTRNEIRRTFDNKIPYLEIVADDKNLKINYKLSKQFEYSQGRVPERICSYRGCKIFSAYYQKKIISNLICFDCQKVLRAKSICSQRLKTNDHELYKLISYASRRLIYEAIKYGIANNYELFDLGSINFKKKNLAQFKMSFGPQLAKEYTYTYMSPSFQFFKKGVGLKKYLKKLLNI